MTKDIDTKDESTPGRKHPKRPADLLDSVQHLSGAARITALAHHVWGSGPDAETFLNSPHPLLDGRTPLGAATSQAGARQAEDILWRIVYGIPV